jgi:hypothetical protein
LPFGIELPHINKKKILPGKQAKRIRVRPAKLKLAPTQSAGRFGVVQ